jgi:translation initiation factor IF-2
MRKGLSAQQRMGIPRDRDARRRPVDFGTPSVDKPKLQIVLKADSMGSAEAITAMLASTKIPEADIKVIHSGVGAVSKQDLLMAQTGSSLVVGFNVGVAPRLDQWVKEHGVEVRIYDVIYKLAEDLGAIARGLVVPEPEEKITGKCEVIATFKSVKGGMILGCEVVEGSVQVGRSFRVVTAMGPVHSARIESLQIEKQAVKEARPGQQVGVKVAGFSDAKAGDFIECYEVPPSPRKSGWTPKGNIVHLKA